MVTRPAARTKGRTMVIPMTPPFAAMRRMASSVLQRALPGTSARQLEGVTRTGFRDASKMRRVLLANQDTDLAESFGLLEIGESFDALELVRVRRQERVPPQDVSQRLRVDVPLGVADGRVEHRDSRIPQAEIIGLPETGRAGLPRRQLPVVQSQQPQHVDDRAAANQVHGANRVLRCTLGKKGESAAVQHRRTYG